jgi:hypothetical protein
MEVLDHIPFELDMAEMRRHLRVEQGSEDGRQLGSLADQARAVANPKALYKVAYVDHKGDDAVTIDGITFSSRILRANLDRVERVFAYIATCGAEFDRLDLPADDLLGQYWLDAIKAAALRASIHQLSEHLDLRYALGKTASMNPGSAGLQVWPIEQQRLLFALFGDVESLIGVRLTDSFLMIPNKTVSGVRFPTEVDFRSCQVCERPACPSRAAVFDAVLMERYEHGLDEDA